MDKDARLIWDYMHMNHHLEKVDAIFVLCSHDTRVATYAAELYEQGYADRLIISGGLGRLTEGVFDKPEAQIFMEIAVANGVPQDRIILEDRSANTGENILFTYDVLQQRKLHFNSFILVQKPYMERRTYATFKKQWPDAGINFYVTSPQLSFEEYCSDTDKDTVISIMVGDLQRIKEYPARGFQIVQPIPEDVWQAYERLVEAGHTEHLLHGK